MFLRSCSCELQTDTQAETDANSLQRWRRISKIFLVTCGVKIVTIRLMGVTRNCEVTGCRSCTIIEKIIHTPQYLKLKFLWTVMLKLNIKPSTTHKFLCSHEYHYTNARKKLFTNQINRRKMWKYVNRYKNSEMKFYLLMKKNTICQKHYGKMWIRKKGRYPIRNPLQTSSSAEFLFFSIRHGSRDISHLPPSKQ